MWVSIYSTYAVHINSHHAFAGKAKANELLAKHMGKTYFEDKERVPAFHGKENIQTFQTACKQLKVPVTFGTEELEKQNVSKIVACLFFLAHLAYDEGKFWKASVVAFYV
jgi:hypothetical protein